jgi:hypothetical protein
MRYVKKRDASSIFGKDIVHNTMYDDINERVENDIAQYDSDGWNVYYATAGFGAQDNAQATNAVAKKELYIDIDCGDTKPYTTKEAGLLALRDFCKSLKLPRPTILDSGNGLHAHWYFTEAVPVHEWKEVADALKAHHMDKGFDVDGVCTSDIVRVLRIPGPINQRGGATTKLLTPVEYYDFSTLQALIGVSQTSMFAKARQLVKHSSTGMSEISKLIASNRTSKFETIWVKSMAGNGCAQVKYAIENADTLSEPLWRGNLSTAQHCEDRDWGIHELSKNHPNYSPEETEKKAADTKGPYTCETFQKMDMHHLCQGCQHIGKITAPIQLGQEFNVAKVEDNKVVVQEVTYDIPSYPFPYFRGAQGGIYRYPENKDDDEEGGKPLVIYPHDIYAFSRARDAELGDIVWIRIHLPKDGVREFMIPQSCIGAIDKLRDAVNKEGAMLYSVAQLRNFQDFIGRQVQELQMQESADDMYTRFGWTPNETFIVGNREYTKEKENGVRIVPIARHLSQYVQWFTPKGTLEQWKKVAAVYENEEFDMQALAVCAGFGSILMYLSPEPGGLLHLYSKKSGTGKTTALQMVNSIFGHPTSLMKNAGDTPLSKVHRIGLLNGLPVTLDEMTNSSPEEISNLAYGITQGRARDRMMANANEERINKMTWKAMGISTGNTSYEDKMLTIKADPQGEMARILEIYIPVIKDGNTLETSRLFATLADNYGHAGDVFLRYVIPNLEAVRKRMKESQDFIYSQANWSTSDRYKLNALMCLVAGGTIATEIGLINFHMSRLGTKAVKLTYDAAQEQRAKSTTAVETFAAYVNRFVNNMLVINHGSRIMGMSDRPVREPKGSLLIRYEPDTKTLYITQREFHKWCAEQYINAKEMKLLFMAETGKELILEKKRIAKGWNADFGSVSTYVIKDATKLLGIDDEDLDGLETDVKR